MRTINTLLLALPLLFASNAMAQNYKGCFSSSSGMTSIGSYIYQSPGYCQQQCQTQGKAVYATTKGSDCWCGDQLPPSNAKTSDSSCDSKCNGFGSDSCGGQSTFSVGLTGTNMNPGSASGSGSSNNDDNSNSNSASAAPSAAAPSSTSSPTTSDSSTSTTKAPTSVVTHASTIVVTAPGQSAPQTTIITTTQTPQSKSGPNVAGIAAGVVVGVVALAAIAGGLFFFLRQRRRRAVEEEFRQNAAAASTFPGQKHPLSSSGSMSDSRLEPSVMMQRRQSDGSIADNQDYSRRILKVTNPDG